MEVIKAPLPSYPTNQEILSQQIVPHFQNNYERRWRFNNSLTVYILVYYDKNCILYSNYAEIEYHFGRHSSSHARVKIISSIYLVVTK